MQLLHICYSRTMRCVIVALFLFILSFTAMFGMRGNVEKLPELGSTTAQAASAHGDKILSKSYKLPDPIAAVVKKGAFSLTKNMHGSAFSRDYSSKIERLMGILVPTGHDQKNKIRFYIFYLLGVLVLLKKQSIITYLHKRDVSGGPVCLFAL